MLILTVRGRIRVRPFRSEVGSHLPFGLRWGPTEGVKRVAGRVATGTGKDKTYSGPPHEEKDRNDSFGGVRQLTEKDPLEK